MPRIRLASAATATVMLVIAAGACSSSSKPSSSATTSTTATSNGTPAAIPTAKTIAQPVTYGYYDGHVDWMLSTDVSNKAQATAQKINYSSALLIQAIDKFPSLYLIKGKSAPNQPMVFGSEPGEDDYSPLWRELDVKWKPGVTPVLLVRDDQVNMLASQGKLTVTKTAIVLNCPIVKMTKATTVPTATTVSQPVVYGYYDGHVDTMLSTDVSNKNQATAKNINYAPSLLAQPAGKNPSLYMVSGTAAPNQPVVFNTEPGESDYSPLWQEVTVTWKPGVKPVLLVKDDQINTLAGKGQLTLTHTGIVLNCPIVRVSA
jgi:hypothetical protein